MVALLFAAFLLLILIGIDVGLSMILSAWLGIAVKTERAVDSILLPQTMMNGISFYALVQIPLFIFAGELMNRGGVTTRLIAWSEAMVGHLKGSLGHVSILTNLGMAGISGSAVADAIATGKPLIPAMVKAGYGQGFAGGVIIAGALLGPIIPPSIPMVIYAQMANVSVGKLFVAGIVPGLLLAAGFFAICAITARVRDYPKLPRVDLTGKLRATSHASWALAMPVIIVLGIRFGLFTDTEVAAVVVVYALAVGLFVYRDLRLREVPGIAVESARSSATVLFLLAAAGPFSWLVAESQVDRHAVDLIRALTSEPVVALLYINLFLLVVGILIEPLPAMVIFLPALLPMVPVLGVDPIQFGAVVVINLLIGLLTPPVGMLLFVVANIGKIPLGVLSRGVWPFLAWSIVVLVLLILFPPLTTWLPQRMM
jgi:tripartite ATP-independent transporter DctM subunit